jgi:[NiFe] hydrogenase large subunit
LGGFENYLAYGEFQLSDNDPESHLFPEGVIIGREIFSVDPVDLSAISEHVRHSFYSGGALHPSDGETNPKFPTDGYDPSDRYSWLKAPRYNGEPMEVGPLARVLVAYGSDVSPVRDLVDGLLSDTGLSIDDLHSTLGRVAARAIETKVVADEMKKWTDKLTIGENVFIQPSLPNSANGVGLNEAPRGALGHWISIQDKKIGNYQMVVPSTWNCGPRCGQDKRGPLEKALIGTPIENPEEPLEVLRIVHSFDPCIACAVHVIDMKANQTYKVRVL